MATTPHSSTRQSRGEMTDPTTGFDVDKVLAGGKIRPGVRTIGLARQAFRIVHRASPSTFRVVAVLQVVSGVVLLGQLLVIRWLLQRALVRPTLPFSYFVWPTVLLAALTAATGVAAVVVRERQRLLNEMAAVAAMTLVIDVANEHELLSIETPAFHDRVMRAALNAQIRPAQMVNGVLSVLQATISVAAVAVALVVVQPLFAALVMVAYVPAWIAARRASVADHRYSVEQVRRSRRLTYLEYLLLNREHAKEIRSLGIAQTLRGRYERLWAEKISDLRSLISRRTLLGAVGVTVSAVFAAATIAGLLWMMSSGRSNAQNAGAAVAAIVVLGQRLQGLQSGAAALHESSLFIEDFTSFVGEQPSSVGNEPPAPTFTDVRLDHVSFTYPAGQHPAVTDVSLSVATGEVVALVGENGSGKTTLALIVAGLLPPASGHMLWNGIDAATYAPASIRKNVTVLFQDFGRFQLTADDNVRLGAVDHWDDTARRDDASERAGTVEFIDRLTNGWDTQLGTEFDAGTDLSGGEWQRLALARALFRSSRLVILDEPTAALDPRAEADLYRRMRTLAGSSGVLLISHRLASVRYADRIIVMDHGRVVETGTHDQLIAAGGQYHEMYQQQSDAYF